MCPSVHLGLPAALPILHPQNLGAAPIPAVQWREPRTTPTPERTKEGNCSTGCSTGPHRTPGCTELGTALSVIPSPEQRGGRTHPC